MDKLIIRNDDVSASSDMERICEMYDLIWARFPEAVVWSGVSVFSRGEAGSVYPELPLFRHPVEWFYNADKVWIWIKNYGDKHKIASHGLYHIDHSQLSKDAQAMSILGSCKYLKTDVFAAPYGKGDADTEIICRDNNIQLVLLNDKWKSLEFNKFDPSHKHWYFHSWRYDINRLKEQLG